MKKIKKLFCKKARYCSQEFAEFKAKPENNHFGVQMREYRCPFCQGWHLTKRLKRR